MQCMLSKEDEAFTRSLLTLHTLHYQHTTRFLSLQLLPTLGQIAVIRQPALHIRSISLQPTRLCAHAVRALLQ